MKYKHGVTVHVDDEMHAYLTRTAKARGKSVADFVRCCVQWTREFDEVPTAAADVKD